MKKKLDFLKEFTEIAIQIAQANCLSVEQVAETMSKAATIYDIKKEILKEAKRKCKDKPIKYILKYLWYKIWNKK